MNLNHEFIIQKALEIENDKKTLCRNDLELKYSDFSKQYPKIWVSIMDNIFDIEKFKELVNIHSMSYNNSGGSHQDKLFKSNIDVGEKLARDFLYKENFEPSNEDKQKAYRAILAKRK